MEGIKALTPEDVFKLSGELNKLTEPLGLEIYPFKIGWYNASVQPAFHLPYDTDRVAFIILSVPSMFEKCLIPFIKDDQFDCLSNQDPLDQCMKEVFIKIKDHFKEYKIDGIHDYEVHPNRRPKILVQTAGHVAGAAYYYRQEDIQNCSVEGKLYGVSIHPKYGGWFAFRGALIFENVTCADLVQRDPEDVVKTDELKLELLKKFNYHWKDWSYRDIIKPESTYSEEQKLFFITPPSERKSLLDSMKNMPD
eukprot:Seg515.8 transcript_id=Seg515.8/GoldUCD/mRNA.D3Y31 product="Methylmalonic aciduria and homocystinuria type C protein" protein_id=Seg515.8/GoldUCD/D3Y31